MSIPSLATSTDSPLTIAADVLVLAVSSAEEGPVLHADGPEFEQLRSDLVAVGVTGAKESVSRFPGLGRAASIAVVGLGSAEVTHELLRTAAGAAARQLTGIDTLVFALPAIDQAGTLAVLEGAALGVYEYTEYRHASLDEKKRHANTITVVGDGDAALVERATVVATAVASVKDLVNAPPLDLYPETFAGEVQKLADGLPVTVEVLAEAELAAGGFGGILGVGQGSARGPRLVKVVYAPDSARSHVALVGKGITFDTGGISLKPAASMVGMKYDMTGAATVMAVVLAAARLGLAIKLTAWLCIAENMPSGTAIRPNDVLRIYGGRTVEVLNTDAEGRLVMADGIVAASEEHPDAIIDVATLTGAQRVALGDRYSGVMGDDQLVGDIVDAAKRTGEQLWPMPLPGELRALLNSDVADIANTKIGSTAGGMLLAGVFLQEFVGTRSDDSTARIPWAHIDIAGPSNNVGSPFGFTGKGPTAVTVRALLTLTEDISHR